MIEQHFYNLYGMLQTYKTKFCYILSVKCLTCQCNTVASFKIKLINAEAACENGPLEVTHGVSLNQFGFTINIFRVGV